MGFSRNGCTRALYETKNSGVEAAMNWVMEHMGDANFNDPFVDPNAAKPKKSVVVPDEGNIMMLMDMSFTREQAIKALKMTDNNIEGAVDWIFAHPGDMHHELAMRPLVEVVSKSVGHSVEVLIFRIILF